jgi:hypothetical protein
MAEIKPKLTLAQVTAIWVATMSIGLWQHDSVLGAGLRVASVAASGRILYLAFSRLSTFRKWTIVILGTFAYLELAGYITNVLNG